MNLNVFAFSNHDLVVVEVGVPFEMSRAIAFVGVGRRAVQKFRLKIQNQAGLFGLFGDGEQFLVLFAAQAGHAHGQWHAVLGQELSKYENVRVLDVDASFLERTKRARFHMLCRGRRCRRCRRF